MLSILGPTASPGIAEFNQMGTGLRTAQLIALQHTAGNRAVARLVSDRGAAPVQRAGGAGGAVAESPVKTVALQAVSNAPDVPPESVLAPEKVDEALAAGSQLGPELESAKGNPELAAEFQAQLQSEPDPGGPAPQTGAEVGALQSYLGTLPVGGGPAEPSPGPAPEGAPGPAHASNKDTNSGNTAKSVTSIGTTVSKIGASVSGAGVTMAHAGASIAAALGYVAAGIGAVLAVFDIRSAISSRSKAKELERVMADLKAANPHDSELIDAIGYAIAAKYSKTKTRAAKALTGLLGSGIAIGAIVAGVSLVALASNPVGWVIAAALAGTAALVGIGILAYKLCNKLSKWMSGDLGVQRRKTAMTLYDKTIAGDENAAKALAGLGLDPAKMRARAAEGETPAQKAKRVGGSGYKEVAAKASRHTGKVADSTSLVAGTEAAIAALKVKVLAERQKASRAVPAVAKSYENVAQKLETEIKAKEVVLAKQRAKLGERQKKLKQDDVAVAWKAETKSARNDIKLIERKLKK